MTIKPLSEEDIQFDNKGYSNETQYIYIPRLKELFAELKKYQVSSHMTGIAGKWVHWEKIEELFRPVVPK